MVVTAAQYCLEDSGKLTSELEEHRQPNNYSNNNNNNSSSYSMNSGDAINGNNGLPTSKFAQYKLEKERKRQEALRRAQEEAAAFEQAAEEEDMRAEKEAEEAGKMTASQIEASEPKWPFGQVYHTEEDEVVNVELVIDDHHDMKINSGSPNVTFKHIEFYGSNI
jgi:hypothetical protein